MKPKHLSGILCLFCLIVFAPFARAGKWVRVSSRSGGFSVSMPGAPVSMEMKEPPGRIVVYKRSLIEYYVGYFSVEAGISTEKAYKILESVANSSATEQGERILSRKRMRYGNYPAYETTSIDRENWFGKTRMILVGNRGYIILGTAPKARKAQTEIDKFISSFRLLKR